ncbi:MAG TPA: pyrimidine reductase [Herpetosiphon sp.]|uniref:Bifunctional deaminase-reductase domain protein n=1 Tax=Herpetosiphon aurantiacus (strain ATCC 23779 / DSM 785 / 114-95) TaxID=316274 RepID=A9B4J9_HERA2|nr:dihydrofolate reductase family protein [Herpetosiphon sp.]ABX04164.1 bifunctional deaminase-reductase domain protein [Herpetosiphon aurantiacus DSM 785]HBW48339.1 pyrimidine reductase [Herpetosiphon sp.]
MGKIVLAMFVSLDGVVENPGWSMPYWSDDISAFKAEESAECTALLLGRVTYEGFAKAWPESKDEGAEHMNNLVKYVPTNTLEQPEWNATFLKGDVIAQIRQLREEQNLLIYGSTVLADSLLKHNLIDEYRLLIYPVVVGEGQRLFHPGTTATLKLVETRTMSTGVAMLKYQRIEQAAE